MLIPAVSIPVAGAGFGAGGAGGPWQCPPAGSQPDQGVLKGFWSTPGGEGSHPCPLLSGIKPLPITPPPRSPEPPGVGTSGEGLGEVGTGRGWVFPVRGGTLGTPSPAAPLPPPPGPLPSAGGARLDPPG